MRSKNTSARVCDPRRPATQLLGAKACDPCCVLRSSHIGGGQTWIGDGDVGLDVMVFTLSMFRQTWHIYMCHIYAAHGSRVTIGHHVRTLQQKDVHLQKVTSGPRLAEHASNLPRV
eukprot:jgi/Ulvmu1/103/UM001_0106.1